MILIAKTGFRKSLIFNILPLLLLGYSSLILIVVPLKQIQRQQVIAVSKYPGRNSVIIDVDYNNLALRR